MDLTVEQEPGALTIFALSGELDYSNFEQLVDAAREAYQQGARRLLLDLGGLEYMGSSGLVALHAVAMIFSGQEPPDPEEGWAAYRTLSDDVEGHSHEFVKLLCPTPQVEGVLERTGMRQFFEVHADRSAAVASF
jgi:anti-anti-sigma regulatory factor